MTAFGYNILGFGAGLGATYSLDFESGSSQYLSLADSDFGSYDTAKFTISAWVRRESTGTGQVILHKGSTNSNANSELLLQFSSDQILFRVFSTSAVLGTLQTTATYTSTANFYHIVCWYDSANATAGDRMRLWVDGSEVTSFVTDTNPTAAVTAKSVPVNIGALGNPLSYFDGLINQFAFFSGVNVSATTLYNGGKPLSLNAIRSITGLKSLLMGENGRVTYDSKLAKNFTNNNTVTLSTTKP